MKKIFALALTIVLILSILIIPTLKLGLRGLPPLPPGYHWCGSTVPCKDPPGPICYQGACWISKAHTASIQAPLLVLAGISSQLPLATPSLNLELALGVLAGLVGLPALWSIIIDLLKFAGVVKDGNAGRWSAAFSILSIVGVLVVVNFFPSLDVAGIDKLLLEIAQFAGIILTLLTQIFVAKGTHAITVSVVPSVSFTNNPRMGT